MLWLDPDRGYIYIYICIYVHLYIYMQMCICVAGRGLMNVVYIFFEYFR